ncbi:MAG: tetratricopeptide repeat protein, partial [Desulfovibrio sp.]|nr:tetratricopeptide repeat protein [Desulfovibrio sp.]
MYISAMRQPRYLGVYSERPDAGAPAGGRSGRRPRFFVWELSPADYAIQELDGALEPSSRVRLISAGRLQSGYQLEPSILVAPITLPDIANAERVPETPETAAPRKAAELNDDTLRELEIARRAKQIENDLRGSFRKASRGLSLPREREAALE